MKNLLFIFAVLVLVSCRNEKSNELNNNVTEVKTNEKSILDIEYLNDTLQIAVKDISVLDLKDDKYEISVEMETPLIEKYSKGYKFYIHCYYYDDLGEDGKKFLPIGTNKIKVNGDKITYSRKFTSDLDFFKVIRYGLLNSQTDERYFSLKIDSVDITN